MDYGLILLCLFAAGCDKLPFLGKPQAHEPPVEEPEANPAVRVTDPGVLAVVNGSAITMEMFRQRLDGIPEQNRPTTLDKRRELLDLLIKEELLVQEAVALGLERDPKIKRQLDAARRMVLLSSLAERDAGQGDALDEEIRKFYGDLESVINRRDIHRLRARQIVAASLADAEQVRAQAAQGGDFAQLARERSIGAGRDQGGEVGWYLRQADYNDLKTIDHVTDEKFFFPELEPVAFALEIGQISQPVKGPDGKYYLVKIDERQAVKLKPITEMWNQIQAALSGQKREKLFEDRLNRLTAKAKIERSEQRLEQM